MFIPHYSCGNILLSKKELSGAYTAYSKAIQYDPNYVSAYGNRGNVLQRMGRLAEAITDYQKAISLSPQNFSNYFNLGFCLPCPKRK